jgi:hypothetical protein
MLHGASPGTHRRLEGRVSGQPGAAHAAVLLQRVSKLQQPFAIAEGGPRAVAA